jgi:hypothetical protein
MDAGSLGTNKNANVKNQKIKSLKHTETYNPYTEINRGTILMLMSEIP